MSLHRTTLACRSLVAALLLSAAGIGSATPSALAQTPGTFTYQGVLTDTNTPANGNYDFTVVLFPFQAGGTALATATLTNIPVTNGQFNLNLDFGPSAGIAVGTARWIELRVRPVGAPTFTTLPRQPLNSTPRAMTIEGVWRDSSNRLGFNSDNPLARLDIRAGGDASGSNDGRALAFQWWNSGFRHFVTTRHDSAQGNGNAFLFWTNSASAGNSSTAPGTGNLNAFTITGADTGRIGVGTAAPLSSVHARGANPSLRFEQTLNNRYNYEFRVDNDESLNLRVGTDPAPAFTSLTVDKSGRVGVNSTPAAGAALTVGGNLQTTILTIVGGADIAEPFNIHADSPIATIRPGMVVSIDPARTGELRVASTAYDHTVAGIISGANGVNPGLTLAQPGSIADGKHPVAMTGRVWVLADAASSPIRPGDLLTSSDNPGHAMKATDRSRAGGATIGKAMSSLDAGTGYVLVLVNLQ